MRVPAKFAVGKALHLTGNLAWNARIPIEYGAYGPYRSMEDAFWRITYLNRHGINSGRGLPLAEVRSRTGLIMGSQTSLASTLEDLLEIRYPSEPLRILNNTNMELLATKSATLVHLNTCHQNTLGVCICSGCRSRVPSNLYGHLLQRQRENLFARLLQFARRFAYASRCGRPDVESDLSTHYLKYMEMVRLGWTTPPEGSATNLRLG